MDVSACVAKVEREVSMSWQLDTAREQLYVLRTGNRSGRHGGESTLNSWCGCRQPDHLVIRRSKNVRVRMQKVSSEGPEITVVVDAVHRKVATLKREFRVSFKVVPGDDE